MAKAIYEGIGGVARKVKSVYEGIGGVARKVKSGWIGVGGVARQFFASNKFTFEFTNNNSGLATVSVDISNESYPKLKVHTGKKASGSASLRIYGDFSGKAIVIDGVRDTDGSGGIAFYNSSGTPIASASSITDDGADGRSKNGPFDDCASISINVGKATSKKSRTTQLTYFTLDGTSILLDMCKEAKAHFGV